MSLQDEFYIGKAKLSIRVDSPPSGGLCVVQSNFDFAAFQPIEIICQDWEDDGGNLKYNFLSKGSNIVLWNWKKHNTTL